MNHWYELIKNFWVLLQQGQLPEVGRWNYFLLALLVAVEGPIVTLLGAAAASTGLMRVGYVFIAAAFGNLTADTLWYNLGYHGKVGTLLRVGRLIRLKQSHLDRLTLAMQKHALKILFLAKLTAGFMIPSLIATGLARIPWRRWFPVVLLGEMIWTGILVIIGYYTTETIKVLSGGIKFIMLISSIFFLVIMIWEGRRILFKTKEFNDAIHCIEDDDQNNAHPDH